MKTKGAINGNGKEMDYGRFRKVAGCSTVTDGGGVCHLEFITGVSQGAVVERGYVKLWRKSNDSVVFADPHLWQLWCWILMKATHTSRPVAVRTGRGQTTVTLSPGQFIFGRHTAAQALKWKASTTYDRMKRLKKQKNIDIQPGTHFSIVTVLNWGIYQGNETPNQQPTRQATRHPTDTQPTQTRIIELEECTSSPDANASGIEERPADEALPEKKTKRTRKKHPVYRMTPQQYSEYVSEGINGLLTDEQKIAQWQDLYPTVDIENEIHNAAGWLLDRTEAEKDRRPQLAPFVGNWLRKTNQNSNGRNYDSLPA